LVLALPKAIRLADEFKQVRIMRETVQEGAGQAFIAKDLRPIGKA
jgi:hypothetical protein